MENGIVLAILALILIVWVLWLEHKLKKEQKSNNLLPQNQFSLMNKEKPQVFIKMGLWLSRNHKKIVYQVFWSYFLFLIFLFVFNIEINRLLSFIFWFLFGVYVGSRLTDKAKDENSNNRNIPHWLLQYKDIKKGRAKFFLAAQANQPPKRSPHSPRFKPWAMCFPPYPPQPKNLHQPISCPSRKRNGLMKIALVFEGRRLAVALASNPEGRGWIIFFFLPGYTPTGLDCV